MTQKEELRKKFEEFYHNISEIDGTLDYEYRKDIFNFFYSEIEVREKQIAENTLVYENMLKASDNEPIEFFRWLHKTNKVSLNKKLFRGHIDKIYADYKLMKTK